MYTLSCISLSHGHVVWVKNNLSAADVLHMIPSVDCGAEYHVVCGPRRWRIYHGSRRREYKEVKNDNLA